MSGKEINQNDLGKKKDDLKDRQVPASQDKEKNSNEKLPQEKVSGSLPHHGSSGEEEKDITV